MWKWWIQKLLLDFVYIWLWLAIFWYLHAIVLKMIKVLKKYVSLISSLFTFQSCSRFDSSLYILHIPYHTGIFAQNSFQIDSMNSCSTSKKLLFWLKIVKIIQFLTLKPIKGTLGFILKILKKIARWRHKSEISKRNVKTMISPLLFRL